MKTGKSFALLALFACTSISNAGIIYQIVDPTQDIADGEQRNVTGWIELADGTSGTLTGEQFGSAVVDYEWNVSDGSGGSFGVLSGGPTYVIGSGTFEITSTAINLVEGTLGLSADGTNLRILEWVNKPSFSLYAWAGLEAGLSAPSPAFSVSTAATLFGGGSWTVAAVPEPATMGLVVLFGGGVLAVRRIVKT